MAVTHQKLAQGEQSRERLVEAACELVGAEGYAGTSVDAIAVRAGVVKSALYWHFGSKQGLLLAALERQTAAWIDESRVAADQAADPVGRLDRLVDRIRDELLLHPHRRRLVFSALLERGDADPECRATVARVFRELRTALADGLRAAAPFLPADRADDMAAGFVAQCDGILLEQVAEPDPERLARRLRAARRAVLVQIEHELRRSA